MRVVVYKNLNRGDWTIAEVSGRSGRGRKIKGVASIKLANVTFHVQPAAQRKVFEGAARSVHAWAVGDIAENVNGMALEVHYNPKRRAFFHLDDGTRVNSAARVEFAVDGRAWVLL